MRQKIYSTLVLFSFLFFVYLYGSIFFSSLRLESDKSSMAAKTFNKDVISEVSVEVPVNQSSYFYETYIQDPASIELYLRLKLHDYSKTKDLDTEELYSLYQLLLKTRPSWPYYYSGLAQVQYLANENTSKNFRHAMQNGPHERKVVYSLAEMLFYNWNNIDETNRFSVLDYLIDQPEPVISLIVNVSAKFAKVFEYCDYIYNKKHVEYRACKTHYWQPLLD